jgi:GTP-sensing pleiotropic transcriptional regulator CodY
MTTRNFYETIAANETLSADLREFAAAAIEKMDKSAASRAEKAAEKKSIEDAPIIEAITNYLRENPGAHTASDIANAVGIKTPKATAVLRKVEGVNVGEGVVNKRIVKTYSL